ncbi:MAG: hypothetical protein EXR98_01910 [Gemmataceae bacterium]|nr:hypothetical protein [Gemmataceae bacterium]
MCHRASLVSAFLIFSAGAFTAISAPDRPAPPSAPDPFEAEFEKTLKDEGAYVTRAENSPDRPIRDVTNVRKPTDLRLGQFTRLRYLEQLQLIDIGDDQLRLVAELTQVRKFSLFGHAKLTDAGIKELAQLPALEQLFLCGGSVTDAGIKALTDAKRLRVLGLQSVPITDAGMKHMAELKQLRSLYLNMSAVTGAQLDSLKHLDLDQANPPRLGEARN